MGGGQGASFVCLLHECENCCTRRDEEGVLEGFCYCKLLIHRVLREACAFWFAFRAALHSHVITLSRYHVFDFE